MNRSPKSAKVKTWVAVGLSLSSLVLVLVDIGIDDHQTDVEVLQNRDLRNVQAQIDAEIDSLLIEYDVQIEGSRKRWVLLEGIVEGGNFFRVERDLVALESFSTIDFNRRLSNLGARYGVQVSAKENRKLRTTTMDLRLGDTTIETILFVAGK